jgi:glutamate racemase
MRLGILDSDLGGLILARWIRQHQPQWELVVAADTARAPLGRRTPEAIGEAAGRGADFLAGTGVDAIVISCHVLASIAGERLAKTLEMPVLSISEAAVSAAVAVSRKKRFGLLAARATVDSGYFEEALRRLCSEAKVFSEAPPLLTQLVEADWLKKPVTGMIVKTYLRPLKIQQIDTLILGCSHLVALEKTLSRKAGARVSLVTGLELLLERLGRTATETASVTEPADRRGALRVCVTENTPLLRDTASAFFKGPVVFESMGGRRTGPPAP